MRMKGSCRSIREPRKIGAYPGSKMSSADDFTQGDIELISVTSRVNHDLFVTQHQFRPVSFANRAWRPRRNRRKDHRPDPSYRLRAAVRRELRVAGSWSAA